MKLIISVFWVILVLAVIGIVIAYKNNKINDTSGWAVWVQAIATVVLVLITGYYAFETRQSRIAQEEGFDKYVYEIKESRRTEQQSSAKYIKELQESRKQEVKPHIYGMFYWCENLGKFFFVLKNVGIGPAFDIKATYSVIDNNGEEIKKTYECGMLNVDKEKVEDTPFFSEHKKIKTLVEIQINYKDSFEQDFSRHYKHSLDKSASNPDPVEYIELRRKIEKESRKNLLESAHKSELSNWFDKYYQIIKELQQDVRGIKEKMK